MGGTPVLAGFDRTQNGHPPGAPVEHSGRELGILKERSEDSKVCPLGAGANLRRA